ncbi:MAG TPA: hypothetical protein VGK32_15720 [Vicinamibacterales bacterium]|jgi:hypothetical protein
MLLRSGYVVGALLVLTLTSIYLVAKVRPMSASWAWRFTWLAAVSVIAFVVCVLLHNLVSGLLRAEEPVFFILAVIVSPLTFLIGVIGAIVASIVTRGHASC